MTLVAALVVVLVVLVVVVVVVVVIVVVVGCSTASRGDPCVLKATPPHINAYVWGEAPGSHPNYFETTSNYFLPGMETHTRA